MAQPSRDQVEQTPTRRVAAHRKRNAPRHRIGGTEGALPGALARAKPITEQAVTITHNSILEEALRLAALGYPVFPLRPGDKRPLTRHGYKDATTNEAQLRAWWSQYPDANIGIATGKASGLVVLDIDPRHGGDEALAALEAAHGAIDRSVMARTGGQGTHIYFRAPEDGLRNSAGRLGKGLDVRGDGGYIVAPTSVHASGKAYSWEPGHELGEGALPDVPGWMLLALAGSLPRPTRRTPAATTSEPTSDGGAGLRIFEGQRHSKLVSIAGGLRRRGMGPKAIGGALSEINRTSCEPPLPAEEIERIATSMEAYQPANGVRSRSFSSACEVLRDPQYSKLVGGTLEFDEFAEAPTINRRLITDQDIDRIRDAIERTITFVDKMGRERGIQFSHDEMGRAVHLVARERPFHPVRDYLKRLTWDGVPRLSTLLPAWLRLLRSWSGAG